MATDLFEDEEQAFHLKGTMLAITVLEIVHYDLEKLDRQLAVKVAQAPEFFANTPLIIALDKIETEAESLEFRALVELCRKHGLQTLAIRTDQESYVQAARDLELAVLPPSGAREKNIELGEGGKKSAEATAPTVQATKVITSPVRSGQQIYARDGDVILLAPVSTGAEVLADGHIHVYAPVRGRLMAGCKGDVRAKVFCQTRTPEIVAIAGIFKTAEDLRRDPLWEEPAQISLVGEELKITPL